jgi:hypothetical protein
MTQESAITPGPLTATSVTDTSKSASLTLSIQSPDLAAPSMTTALPLTPIQLPTTGVNPSLPVQITYSDPSGISGMNVTVPAISVGLDGTVIAAVPLFANQQTQAIGAGNETHDDTERYHLALASLRGQTGQQKITVEHVHVYEGGQAIVGSVDAPRGKWKLR